MMKHVEAAAAAVFGLAFLVLALAVAVETMMRKVFNRSLQGVDELGGYILAGGAALAIAVAVISRAHIRIDLLHDFAPKALRILLNIAAALSLLACAAAIARMAWIALDESKLFMSTAQTPWATPLWIPQTAWYWALLLFVLAAGGQVLHLVWLAVTGKWTKLDRAYGPRGARDELADELEDLRQRGVSPSKDTL
jgi:TRAP-type C4-dicarboxylate transport system permease small subunit